MKRGTLSEADMRRIVLKLVILERLKRQRKKLERLEKDVKELIRDMREVQAEENELGDWAILVRGPRKE